MKNQWAALAGVRFYLAAVVIFGHVAHFCVMPHWAEMISHLDPFSAVLSFFLISGFSISASLDREPGGLKYYERRINRIYPVYLAGFLLAAVPFLIWGQSVSTNGYGFIQAPHSVWDFLASGLLLQGLLTDGIGTLTPAWTLGIEAQLYLLAPLLRRLSLPVLLSLLAASLLCFINFGQLTRTDLTQQKFGEGLAFLGWAWVLGFVYHRHRQDLWAKALLLGVSLLGGCLHIAGVGELGPLTLGVTVFALLYGEQITARFSNQLTYLGDVSYPLYVVHWPVMVLLAGGDSNRSFWLYLTLPFAAALALLHGVDLPYRAYAKKSQDARRLKSQPLQGDGPVGTLSARELDPAVGSVGALRRNVEAVGEERRAGELDFGHVDIV